jgi:hypothetical protein
VAQKLKRISVLKISYQKKLLIFLYAALFFLQLSSVGQGAKKPVNINLPIPIEFLAGNNRFAFQTQINKYFSQTSKFNFLSITSSSSSYTNDTRDFDFINTSQVSYAIYKGFAVSGGISINTQSGFHPTAGVQYVYATRQVLVVIAPGILLTKNHNVQGVSVLEYKPPLKNNWSLYSKVQGFYNYNIDDSYHQRSYILTRLGLTYKQVGFGLGANWDWYGNAKDYKENYGVFLKYSFL